MRNQSTSDRVAALEEELSTLQAEAEEARARLSEKETSALETQAELAQAKREAAAERYQDAFRAREQAAARVAEGAEQVLDDLDEYDDATRALREVIEDIRAAPGDGVAVPDLDGDPEVLVGTWDRLEERVRERISDKLADDLVEEAARSGRNQATEDLPEQAGEVEHTRWRARIEDYLDKT